MARDFKIDLGFNYDVSSLENIRKAIEKINLSARELADSFKTNEGKKYAESFQDAKDAFAKMAVERQKILKLDESYAKQIKQMENARALAQKQGNSELAQRFKETSRILQIERKANSESLRAEKEMTAEIEKQKSLIDEKYRGENNQREKANKIRDDFRTRGIKTGLKNFNPVTVLNNEINSRMKKNDSIISNAADRMREIDKELLATDLTEEERNKLQAEKENLQNKSNIASLDNKKLAVGQTAMNTAINSVKKLGSIATGVFKVMGIDLKSIMSDVFASIKKMLDTEGIASFDIGNSLFSNATARNQQLKYGISGASNYALTQTKELLNIRDDEDLMWMNQNQKEIFNNLMDKYRNWYENLESTGAMVKLQEAQLEFKMFKQELSMKLLNWFANHKEAIFKILEITMNVLEFIANVVEGILNLIPGSKKSSASALNNSDTYNSNTNSNVNINVNNTNNATANLNSQAELSTTLNSSNDHLVKQIATALTSR